MVLGLAWPGEAAQVVVPLLAALLALAWPVWQQFQRRRTFTRLVRAELLEAAPYPKAKGERSQWTDHLTKRLVHEHLIGNPTDNAEFVLSLNPHLTYSLSELWTNFTKAQTHLKHQPSDETTNAYLAGQWCWYLASVCQQLDQRRRSRRLTTEVWQPWHDLLAVYYPPEAPDTDGGHHHLPAIPDQPPPLPQQAQR